MTIPLKISYYLAFTAICTCICESLAIEKCAGTTIGLDDEIKFPDRLFTSSFKPIAGSTWESPDDVRMKTDQAWFVGYPDYDPSMQHWVRIDLQRSYRICAFGVMGGYFTHIDDEGVYSLYKGYVTLYSLKWHYRGRWDQRELPGTQSLWLESKTVLDPPIIADTVIFIPKEYKLTPAMNIQIYGFHAFSDEPQYGKRPTGMCVLPLGLENNGITNDQISASSEENSKEKTWKNSARLNCVYSWRAGKNVKGEYIQVDLGQIMHVTGIAVQGDHCGYRWVKSFKLQHSTDGKKFDDYQSFKGPSKVAEIATSWFSQTLNTRFVRVTVEEWHEGISLRMELYGCYQTCDNQFIGLENGMIAHSQLSSSSTLRDNTPAKYARLNYKASESWCASLTDNNAYLQIDLKSPHVLCAISTQGNSKNDQTVTSYTIQTSVDGSQWTDYKVNNELKIFVGNSISTVIAKNFFDTVTVARYVRILPKSYIGAPCMRMELYGVQKWSCDRAAVGVGSPSKVIPNYRMRSTSDLNSEYVSHFGRVNDLFTWAPRTADNYEFLQIDLGDPMILCAVGIQAHNGKWRPWSRTTSFKISFSIDGKKWTFHPQDLDGVPTPFSIFKTGVVYRNSFSQPHTVKFIRIYPLKYTGYKGFKTELYGIRQGWKESIGLERYLGKPTFQNRNMTASSSKGAKYTAESVRLYSKNSWCTTATNNAYIQFDLGAVKQLLGIAMQGDGDAAEWVTEYKLGYGFTLDEMLEIKNIPTGLHNNRDVKIHWFPSPLGARHVRISPTKWYTKGDPCIRAELYVNNRAPTAYITQSHVHGNLTATPGSYVTVTCSASGDKAVAIKWFLSGHDVTDKSAGSTYSKRLTTSKLRVNFTSIYDVRSTSKCINVENTKAKCSTTVDCVSERYNANGDKKTHIIDTTVARRKPLGLQTLGIGNDQISASSEENSKEKTWKNSARLNCVYSWRAGKNVKGEYIQVDLGQMMDVTGIDIQGDHAEDRWVTKFLVKYSTDGVNWKDYETFNGNTKASEIIEICFDYELEARYIKVVVLEWHGGISMRLELYGCKETCDKQFVGLGNGQIKDNQLSASSHLNENTSPKYARLYKEGAWCARLTDKTPWLQINLGTLHVLCAVQTQGNSKEDQIVTSFTMQLSIFGQNWADYKEDNKIKVFEGNAESNTIAKNVFNRGILARYVRIIPTSFIGAPCMRVELYGVHKWACERTPLGVGHPTYDLADHRMSCSTSINNYRAYDGRMNGGYGWEPKSNTDPGDFLQIDIGEPHLICAIDVQGNGQLLRLDERTLSMKVSYSLDGVKFTFYPLIIRGNEEYITKEKTGQVVKNVLIKIILAKFVRIYPLKYHNYKCLRTEIHGINLGNKVPVGLELIRGKPSLHTKWMSSSSSYDPTHTSIYSRLYGPHSWCSVADSYIQYDLEDAKQIEGIAIQGDVGLSAYVKKYTLQYGFIIGEWKLIENIETKLTTPFAVSVKWLSPPIFATYIRLLPKEYKSDGCIRAEIYVNPQAPTMKINELKIQGDLAANPKADLTITCSAFGNKEDKIKWLLSGNDVTFKSFDNSYSNRLITSNVRFSFSDILHEVRQHRSCVNIEGFRLKCITRADCVSIRRNANHDRKSHEITIILDANLNPITNDAPMVPTK